MVHGCCGAGTVKLETGPMTLPVAQAATGMPASWFVTVKPGAETPSAALEACLDGDTSQLERTLAVVDVGSGRIAVAGQSVATWRDEELQQMVAEGLLLTPLFDALLELADDASQVAAIGCRPWEQGSSAPPGDRRDRPPLLLAVDAGTPVQLMQMVVYTAGQAQFAELAWLVADSTPAPLPAADGPLPGDGRITVSLSETNLSWSYSADGEVHLTDPETPGSAALATGSVEQFAGALDTLAPEGTPEAMIVLDGGTMGSLVNAQDRLAQQGIHCATLAGSLELASTAPAFDGGGAVQALDSAQTLAVLPILLPVLSIAPDGRLGHQTLLTGHRCTSAIVQVKKKVLLEDGALEPLDIDIDLELLELLSGDSK